MSGASLVEEDKSLMFGISVSRVGKAGEQVAQ